MKFLTTLEAFLLESHTKKTARLESILVEYARNNNSLELGLIYASKLPRCSVTVSEEVGKSKRLFSSQTSKCRRFMLEERGYLRAKGFQ
jgi:hypothetical protein